VSHQRRRRHLNSFSHPVRFNDAENLTDPCYVEPLITGRTDEILHLSLQETYCLPILMYASPGYFSKKRQLSELNACWNSMYRKIADNHKSICGYQQFRLNVNSARHIISLCHFINKPYVKHRKVIVLVGIIGMVS
jgi:hypothetical protein